MKISQKIKLFSLFSVSIFTLVNCVAQSTADILRKENQNNKIALKDILGDWFWFDSNSVKNEISFINENDYFIHIPQIKHGVGSYSFRIEKDSVTVNGSAPNWPPYYCTLELIDKSSLNLLFYTLQAEGHTRITCRRE